MYFLLPFPLFLLTLFLLSMFKSSKNSSMTKTKLPPSPPKLPIIGNLHQLGKLPHQSLHKLSQQHGPIMLLKLGTVPILVVSSPHFAKQILKQHDISFCSRPSSPGTERLFYNCSDVAFSPFGDHWRNARKIFVGHLMSAKRAELFARVREIEIEGFVDYLSAVSTNPIDLDEKIFDVIGGIVGRVAFGKSYRWREFEGVKLKGVMDEAMQVISSFSAEDFFPFFGRFVDFVSGHKARVENCFRTIDGFYEMILDEHFNRREDGEEEEEEEDFVDVLIGLLREQNGLLQSKEHLKALLMNTFLGGVDTSAIVIVWAMCELIRNPRVMKKVQKEIRCKLGRKTRVEANDIDDLTYMKMVVKEVLRLHPPAPFLVPRECMRACKISGENGEVYDVYQKTRVLVNAWAIGRDPNKWRNPNEFFPKRFEKNDVDFRGQHFEFVPFGGGRRICPGISNGLATVELTLANLLYWFNWEVPKGMELEDVASLEEEGGITVHKRTHLTLVPIKYSLE
ncbi:cytochrome P450 [Striga asiatica]|uniref:Cytochrome P450 n=1 Tax=Striga asiatica TaxID=4170 RepID=A0A5A7R7Q3_STRAF|nr:cytochrome P450 [Striga asiatica]